MRWRSAIVLVVLEWGGLVVSKILRVYIDRLVEELHWLGNLIEINVGNLVHLLELLDIDLKFPRVGRVHGQVFAQLDII